MPTVYLYSSFSLSPFASRVSKGIRVVSKTLRRKKKATEIVIHNGCSVPSSCRISGISIGRNHGASAPSCQSALVGQLRTILPPVVATWRAVQVVRAYICRPTYQGKVPRLRFQLVRLQLSPQPPLVRAIPLLSIHIWRSQPMHHGIGSTGVVKTRHDFVSARDV